MGLSEREREGERERKGERERGRGEFQDEMVENGDGFGEVKGMSSTIVHRWFWIVVLEIPRIAYGTQEKVNRKVVISASHDQKHPGIIFPTPFPSP